NIYNFQQHFIDLSVTGFFSVGGSSNAPAYFDRNQYDFSDDLDIVRGRHHLMFGAQAIAIQMNEVNLSLGNGEFGFNGSLSNNALTDFFLGRPSGMTQANPEMESLRQKYYGLYVQDDFKVNRKLNIHYGVRWEPS